MNSETYKLTFVVENDVIVLHWKRKPHVTEEMAKSRYPELEMRLNYRDICKSTVVAMLRDLEVPDSVSKAILTRIAANAA